MISQYIGRNDKENAGVAASQLLLLSAGFSAIMFGMVLVGMNEYCD